MKTIYWLTTALISAYLVLSSYSYLFSKSTIEGIKALGFPNFFRIELAVLKIIAVLILLIPALPLQAKEWAYAGVALFLLTAIIAHIAHKDNIWITVINLVLIGLLAVSYYTMHKLKG
ncbi:MAG: DoxX family protein [Flavobacterium sp.]|uniref:DoxX family protein n=1 Tax=Flavobacterium sp. TaxID=239 RepID=UPI002FCA2FF5